MNLTCDVMNNVTAASKSKRLQFNVTDCFSPCSGEDIKPFVTAEPNKTWLECSFCVIADALMEEAFLNGTRAVRGQPIEGMTWDFKPRTDSERFSVTVQTNRTHGDFVVVLMRRSDHRTQLNFTCIREGQASRLVSGGNQLIPTTSTTPATSMAISSGTVEVETSEDFFPKIIRILIFAVLGVIIVVALVLGFIVFRCRGVIFRRIRNSRSRSKDSVQSSAQHECEMQNLVSDYANVASLTANVGESSHFIMGQEGNEVEDVTVRTEQVPFPLYSQDKDTGRYISKDGLVYITLAHSMDRNRSPPKVIHGSENVVDYATLDNRYSGKFNLNDKKGRKEHKKIEKNLRKPKQ